MRRAFVSIIIIGAVVALIGLGGQGLTGVASGEEVTPLNYGEELTLERVSSEWASYADYEARLLTVNYKLTNIGTETLQNLVIMEATATQGVTIYTDPLPGWEELASGDSLTFSLVWNVPEGVTSFDTYTPVGATSAAPDEEEENPGDEGAADDNYGADSSDDSAADDAYGTDDPPATPRLTPALNSVDVPAAPASLPSTGLDLWPW